MSSKYLALKTAQRAEFEAFPIQFAFNAEQFKEALSKLGATLEDTDKVCRLPGGGFIRKTDSAAFFAMIEKHHAEHWAEIAADTDGTGYIYEMFAYELANHEYNYTRDPEPTLDALGLTIAEVEANPVMSTAFKRAKAAQFKGD